MIKVKNNYTYVNSQIKVIEDDILNVVDFEKLKNYSKENFLKALKDLNYSNKDTFAAMVEDALSRTRTYLDEVAPEPEALSLFYLLNDVVNIKYLYKIKVFGLRAEAMFLARGVFSKEVLEAVILNDDYSNLDKKYHKLFKSLEVVLEVTDAMSLSVKIDNLIYEYILKEIKLNKLKLNFNSSLSDYFKMKIDFSNIITLIRFKRLNYSFKENEEAFINGGFIPVKKLEEIYEFDLSLIARSLREYYEEKLEGIINLYIKNNDLNKLEINLENLHLSLLKKYQDDAFGVGIIMYYYLRKLAEARNLKMIYSTNDFNLDNLVRY